MKTNEKIAEVINNLFESIGIGCLFFVAFVLLMFIALSFPSLF